MVKQACVQNDEKERKKCHLKERRGLKRPKNKWRIQNIKDCFPLTDDFQPCAGLHAAHFVLKGNAVEARVLGSHLGYLEDPQVVALRQGEAGTGGDHEAVLVPRNPGCRVARDSALEAHGLTLLCNPVVRNRIEFGGCSLQPTRPALLTGITGGRSFTITMSWNRVFPFVKPLQTVHH